MILHSLSFWLKVSRPGLWFATIWLYLLPTSQMDIWQSLPFWLGFAYITFPLNFLVYGWNDMVDQQTDALNPRKDSFWFGARGSSAQLKPLWKAIFLIQLLTMPYFIWRCGWQMLLLFAALLFVNWIYNLPKNGLRSRPPLELLCQVGYLLVVPFSILVNNTSTLPVLTFCYLFLFAIQSHLMGEVMDIEPDRQSGRKTTATELGMKKTKLIIIGIVLTEVLILTICFQEFIFGGMLALALVWLLLDLFFIFKTNRYTVPQMQLFGFTSNVVALASMAYVWYSGCLLTVPSLTEG
jgi:4-hydroxybenzoate polyprenyltransferase